MGYSKAIIYGTNLELYTYEADIRSVGGKRTGVQSGARVQDMDTDSQSSRTQRLQKRQDNQNRSLLEFRRLVCANISEFEAPVLVTVTYSTNQTDLGCGYEDWKTFARNMCKRFGKNIRYIAVPEFQRRGAVHFHALYWGLPSDTANKERDTRLVASLWGHGYVDVYLTDGRENLAGYLSKYMSKAYYDERMFGRRMYRCSRNIFRPLVEKKVGMWYLSEMYGIGVDNPPCKDKEFQTQWLGKGRFRFYKNIKLNYNGSQKYSSDLAPLRL